MRRDIGAAALQIRNDVHMAEAAFDRTVADNARLVATMLDAKLATGAATTTGDAAVDAVFEAIEHVRTGRRRLLEAHERLADIGRERAVGDVAESPEPWGRGVLTIVGGDSRRAA